MDNNRYHKLLQTGHDPNFLLTVDKDFSDAELTSTLKLMMQDTAFCAVTRAVAVSRVAPDLQQDLSEDLDCWYQRFEMSCCGWAACALLWGGALTRPAFEQLQVVCL